MNPSSISFAGTRRSKAMVSAPEWLPQPIDMASYSAENLETVYQRFCRDFLRSRCVFCDKPVLIASSHIVRMKEQTFWHIVSEGGTEDDRLVSLERCRRINWIRPILENCQDDNIWRWVDIKNRSTRVKLWLRDPSFLVILDEGKTQYRLVTAYPVTREHTRTKLQREYEAFLKSQKPPTT